MPKDPAAMCEHVISADEHGSRICSRPAGHGGGHDPFHARADDLDPAEAKKLERVIQERLADQAGRDN